MSQTGQRKTKTGGRTKGTPNKLTAEVRAAVLQALDQAGGVEYLVRMAQEHPPAFLSLVGRLLPRAMTGDAAAAPITIRVVKPW